MKKYVTVKEFERYVKKIAKKKKVSIEQATFAIKATLENEGIEIGLPLDEKIRRAKVRAGEQVVINELKIKGFIDNKVY